MNHNESIAYVNARWAMAFVAGSMLAAMCGLRAETTIDPAHAQAYGQNIGWLDARGDVTQGAVIGLYYCNGHVWSANCGWISLGSGTPINGYSYGNVSGNDWGVNHDGEGRLTGYAYGANIGWVAFEQTYGQPRVDLRTGILSGYAWGANVGWIGLSNAQACVRTATFATGPDNDNDLLPDAYERRYTGSIRVLNGLNGHDADGDGATDMEESGADTNPLDGMDLLRIVSIGVAGTANRLAWTTRPTRLYRLEAANTLPGAGNWMDAGAGLLGPPALSPMTQTVAEVTDTRRYYRVKAVMPLSE